MKIIFYDNKQTVWFNGWSDIFTNGKIIISNKNTYLEFNSKSIEELATYSVEPLLPIGKITGSNTMIYVPVNMTNKFIEILKYLGFKTKKGDTATIPTSEELGLVKGDVRSSFYDSMTIKDVHVLTEANDMDEIQELFDEITSGDTDVDAVFLTRTDNAPKPILKGSTRENVTINMDRYGSLIQKFLEYVNRTSKVTPGFKNAIFEFNPAITSIVLVGNKQKHLLFFVSETGKDQANFLNSRDEYLPQIKQLLLNAGKIDEIN
jgi:hypothetical protein